jgi:hypothetical protein
VAVKSQEMSNELRNLCSKMADHVLNASFEKMWISRMVAYYKVDEKGRFVFLYATSIRLENDNVGLSLMIID